MVDWKATQKDTVIFFLFLLICQKEAKEKGVRETNSKKGNQPDNTNKAIQQTCTGRMIVRRERNKKHLCRGNNSPTIHEKQASKETNKPTSG